MSEGSEDDMPKCSCGYIPDKDGNSEDTRLIVSAKSCAVSEVEEMLRSGVDLNCHGQVGGMWYCLCCCI